MSVTHFQAKLSQCSEERGRGVYDVRSIRCKDFSMFTRERERGVYDVRCNRFEKRIQHCLGYCLPVFLEML